MSKSVNNTLIRDLSRKSTTGSMFMLKQTLDDGNDPIWTMSKEKIIHNTVIKNINSFPQLHIKADTKH